MSKRDRARRRRHRVREFDKQFGPDPSEIVFEFSDGWTIRKPGSIAALVREGELADHCLRDVPDALNKQQMSSDLLESTLAYTHSLRDEGNVPHITFAHVAPEPGDTWPGCTTEVLGFQNSPVKPEYLERIEVWHHTLPYPTELVLRSEDIEIPDDDRERSAA
jgi:hypothetical protein